MINLNLYLFGDDTQIAYAVPSNLSPLIEANDCFIRIGELEAELTSGTFPVIGRRHVEEVIGSSGREEIRAFVEKRCDDMDSVDLQDRIIASLKYEGDIHLLEYVGDQDSTNPDNFQGEESIPNADHKGLVEGINFGHQFFVTPKQAHRTGYEIDKIDVHLKRVTLRCDPAQFSIDFYVANNSGNEDYAPESGVGKIGIPYRVLKDLVAIKVLDINEFNQMLD